MIDQALTKDQESDADLVRKSAVGCQESFEVLVVRYQNLVCSVAFAIAGNVAASEDIGQESFVAAWQNLNELKDAGTFKSWLCSITRHKALDSIRKRQPQSIAEVPTNGSVSDRTAEATFMKKEEDDFVWESLSALPLNYREPLVLYYRQDQSVSEVANLLDLSVDAVKQRLSRGRQMLRDEVLSKIGDSIRGTAPRAAFTAAVLVSVSSMKAVAGTTAAATAVAGKTTAGASVGKSGLGVILSNWLGPIAAVVAGLFASWLQWSLIRYKNERSLTLRYVGYISLVALVFASPYVALLFGWVPWTVWGHGRFATINVVWWLIWAAINTVQVICYQMLLKKIHERNEESGETPLPIGKTSQWFEDGEGFRWATETMLLGAPLVEVHFGPIKNISYPTRYRKARAWIAIGDIAIGRLVGIGYFSLAPVAIGNMSCGIVSFATVALGVYAVGAVAAGIFAVGALALGATPRW